MIFYITGDLNESGTVDGLDVIYLINFFKGIGPMPILMLSADTNGDCSVNGIDAVYLVNFLKEIGPPPVRGICE